MNKKMGEPVYLIKFCRELIHATTLLNGGLFMRPAASYHTIEREFGDIREASIFERTMVYKNPNSYIYCMTGILLVNNQCILDKRLFKHFGCENGYLVIISYEKFFEILTSETTKQKTFNGLTYSFGFVNYQEKDFIFTKEALLNNRFDSSLFTKSKSFSFESEFRIATSEQFDDYPINENGILDKNFEIAKVFKIFNLPCDLKEIAIVVPISNIKNKIMFGERTIIVR